MTSRQRPAAFGSVAMEYERGRPTYPMDVARWVLEQAPGPRVADVGAGTGKFTRRLVELNRRVIAIDPSPAMLAVLKRELPGVHTLIGRGEALPLEDGSVDAVIYTHAFHWLQRERAIQEASRVLANGGVFGVIWNLRDESVGWVAQLSRLLGGHGREDSWPQGDFDEGVIGELAGFLGLEQATFRHVHQLSRSALVDRVVSTVTFATATAERRVQLMADLDALMNEHPALCDTQTVEYPYVTAAYRARRVPRSSGPGSRS